MTPTPEDQLNLLRRVFDWLVLHTETFCPEDAPGDIKWRDFGGEVAYLLGAVAKGTYIELEEESSPLLYVLTNDDYVKFPNEEGEPPPQEVWNHIHKI